MSIYVDTLLVDLVLSPVKVVEFSFKEPGEGLGRRGRRVEKLSEVILKNQNRRNLK